MTCPHCTRVFTPVDPRDKYCTDACFAEARRQRDLERKTPHGNVEALLAAAKAARLAEERRTGRRRYTIEDGWIQRPGAGDINGNADPNGWGFA